MSTPHYIPYIKGHDGKNVVVKKKQADVEKPTDAYYNARLVIAGEKTYQTKTYYMKDGMTYKVTEFHPEDKNEKPYRYLKPIDPDTNTPLGNVLLKETYARGYTVTLC